MYDIYIYISPYYGDNKKYDVTVKELRPNHIVHLPYIANNLSKRFRFEMELTAFQ